MTSADHPRPGAPLEHLLVATTNPGKIREISRILDGARLTLSTLADLAPVPEPEETGATFAENARLKANYYASVSGLPTVAEDSGLAIDALGGRPGVLSARYPGATYDEKFANLYQELARHPQPWTARFVCALAVVDPVRAPGTGHWALASESPGLLFSAERAVEGEIAEGPRGPYGFGYDPIFFYPPYGKTLGEATDPEKLAISHRGEAFRTLRRWLDAGVSG